MKIEHCAYSPDFYKVSGLRGKTNTSIHKIDSRYRFNENGTWFLHTTYVVPFVQLAITNGEATEYDTIDPNLIASIDKLKNDWEKAFSYETLQTAVKDHDKAKWFAVMYLTADAPAFIVTAVWRALARKLHPDVGGDPEVFRELSNAYDKVRAYGK